MLNPRQKASPRPRKAASTGSAGLKTPRVSQGGKSVQVKYAWQTMLLDLFRQPFSTLLTVMVIAISLTLPNVCYLIWKNSGHAARQWYPSPQLTVYLHKNLKDATAQETIAALQRVPGVAKINALSRQQALAEFRQWSGFAEALDLLDENPLPYTAIITPDSAYQTSEALTRLRDTLAAVQGVDQVRMDISWFSRLTALTNLVGQIASLIALLMVISVFLVIGNSVRLNIFARRDTINVQKLIGATDGFILRPFLYGGAALGMAGALLSLIFTGLMIWRLETVVSQVAAVFGTTFHLKGLGLDESLLLVIIATMAGWLAARLATGRHLKQFSPQ